MKIVWFGHSSFLIKTSSGTRIITDPYTQLKGLSHSPISEPADIVTVSHHHWDHSSVGEVGDSPIICGDLGEKSLRGINIHGFPSFHDNMSGQLRGENIIFRIEADNLVIVHSGDLGTIPAENIIDNIKGCDILMVPVGGIFTIGIEEAALFVEVVSPKAVIPMHYLNQKVPFLHSTAEEFARLFPMVRKTPAEGFIAEEFLGSPVKPVVIIPESAR